MNVTYNIAAAQSYLIKALDFIRQGVVEDVIRLSWAADLPKIFPDNPWWIGLHVTGAEGFVRFDTHHGFVDALVGATAIEYEKNLTNPQIFAVGLGQVRDYCAGLLNEGYPESLIIGVLSDTVHWYAFRIKSVLPLNAVPGAVRFGRDHVELEEIDRAELSAAGTREARLLIEFLVKYLGREGARLLGAKTLAADLGLESQFCERHINGIRELVENAFEQNEDYARLIKRLWSDFVSYFGGSGELGSFDQETYVGELYILTLAKLLCANVLEVKGLSSNDEELTSILDGRFFKVRGLANLVEYDYFGWLNEPPYVQVLLPVARAMQDDLRAYDFTSAPAEDLFGSIMAQLAERSKRLLLGQEFTPTWLAEKIVTKVLDKLPADENPRLVDMCCGSGAMVVETVKSTTRKMINAGISADANTVTRLVTAITGFDIDPLAVMLAKVGWVLAAREWLAGSGIQEITIPVYHADSLFAVTPLTQRVDPDSNLAGYELVLDDKEVALPGFLISPAHSALFDTLLDRGYAMAMESARQATSVITEEEVRNLVRQSLLTTKDTLSQQEELETQRFCKELLVSLEELQRAGHNGVWAFVLRNSYRPGLVAGQFNGLVSNPPWLALSKVADNPYKDALRQRAERYGIKPPGSSHLHIELATIFLLHAIEKYLTANAVVGCVLPETVLNAHHHNPFRKASYQRTARPVLFRVDEIWRIEKGTFKNEAIVFFGKNKRATATDNGTIEGRLASPTSLRRITFQIISQGQRTAWSDNPLPGAGREGFFVPAEFRQGADIMPRTLVFHQCEPVSPSASTWNISPIDRNTGSLRYLVAEAKKQKDFVLTARNVDGQFIFDVLLSHHLTPFEISAPAKAFLPIRKNTQGQWTSVPNVSLAAHGAATSQAFDKVFKAIGPDCSPEHFFEKLDTARGKLSSQSIPRNGWLVFMGAGGGQICAAHASAARYDEKLIVDQTLYWASVPTEEEALYLVGLLNSKAIAQVIGEFQPRGQFGRRHIHTLPFGVTPPYSSREPSHTDVVDNTRSLLVQWSDLKRTNTELQALLDPNQSTLSIRRRKLRENLVSLPAYEQYELACRNLYGL